MKLDTIFQPRNLQRFLLTCSPLAMALSLLMKGTGFDDRGLLISGHWTVVALYILTAIALGGVYLFTRKEEAVSYREAFPASTVGALGCWATALAIGVFGVISLLTREPITFAQNIVGKILSILLPAASWLVVAGSAVCMVLAGICRKQGKTPRYGIYAIPTLYGMLHMIFQYGTWRSEPQTALYFFPLLASVGLLVTFYQMTCLCIGKGSLRWYRFFAGAAMFFCAASIFDDSMAYYIAMFLWTGFTAFPNPKKPEA